MTTIIKPKNSPSVPEYLNVTDVRVLGVIRLYLRDYGYAPTYRDIQAMISKGKASVCRSVDRLERLGYVTRRRYISRSIQWTGKV